MRKQLEVSEQFSPEITSEMKGIAKGAGVSLEDIVILNNYTDFRDIPLPDEGCSTLHVRNEADEALVGQTWDMHKVQKTMFVLSMFQKQIQIQHKFYFH